MTDRPEWMTPAHERVLAHLGEVELATPAEVADALGAADEDVRERVRSLEDHGLTEYLDDGVYRITRDGKAYLAREVDDE